MGCVKKECFRDFSARMALDKTMESVDLRRSFSFTIPSSRVPVCSACVCARLMVIVLVAAVWLMMVVAGGGGVKGFGGVGGFDECFFFSLVIMFPVVNSFLVVWTTVRWSSNCAVARVEATSITNGALCRPRAVIYGLTSNRLL